MKIKVLKRDPANYLRETKDDIHKLPRNYDPELHPMEAAREYKRAVNAVKLERVFAKPFLGALTGHSDGVAAVAMHPNRLSSAASASSDGTVRLWDLTLQKCLRICDGHSKSYVRDIVWGNEKTQTKLFSVGDDKKICLWDLSEALEEDITNKMKPVDTIVAKTMMTGVTHHRYEANLATCGETTTLWDVEFQAPVREYSWGVDSVHKVKFNQIEPHLLAGCASDRSILLYDTRERQPMRKVVMELKSNDFAWNPMEAFVFAVANEDYNVYAFDARQLKRPTNVHMDHTAAVVSLCYAPTGKEIVSGGYDKTARIFKTDEGRSREVYHAKRMQRLTCVAWSGDNRYILTGSDEMNLRLWKAKAWEKMGILKDREKAALNYNEKLKEKYGNHPQVKKILKHRKVPKHVLNARNEHKIIKDSKKRKQANVRKHSKPGTVPHQAERDKHVLREDE